MEDRPKHPNKDQIYTLRMDKKLSEQLQTLANAKGVKPSRFIRDLIRAEVQKGLPPEPKNPVGRPKKQFTTLKKEVDRLKEKRMDVSLYQQLKNALERAKQYRRALNEEVGEFILEQHEKGKLDLFELTEEDGIVESKLAKQIQKMVDDF
jgi:hypothetical protein